jgi:hypothetical protein
VDNVTNLVRATVANPKDNTPASMLADELIDRGDVRGEIIRRDLAGENKKFSYILGMDDPNHTETLHHEEDKPLDGGTGYHLLATNVHRHSDYSSPYHPDQHYGPVFQVYLGKQRGGGGARFFYATPTHAEARDWADKLPNGEQVHKFLDNQYGSDPRKPAQFARHYAHALAATKTLAGTP